MATILLPLAQGFEEVEAVSLIDVLRRAGIDVRVAHMDGEDDDPDLVLGANGITIQADTSITNVIEEDFDMILLPGGWDGTYILAENETVQRLLKEFQAKDKMIGSICAAAFALKTAGVLGNNYTCYPGAKDEVNHPGYREDQAVVVNGNIMTSRGPGTALCFGLEIVKHFSGVETYQAVKDGMLLEFCD
ncbi:MAG: DJ-1/YajL/PfpI superfamily, includes chaperone protein YajL (former ThiJ), parkinsonism-associated protein DJ-1, peptidases PfpI, Hsp31 [uncultured Sulfurovum sp.]|uniref:DJ-1/YajL/PfpI superfamily, includes chaperone protein YajL (Former ThiJ), parkinsonism-associated protein DJ-1, peptidases PfpI, Hsp31 n=1 Tax=uncultured Sulfurovum sp. TaxID=269237 RepID=A0A6S6T4E0_9BACT|nr:MAG: DJ-1/YajL/PfpI superfamily, includes chaperone protein YajL (former ThiJ), parkinsonism-associated protein DJ-1, peptidases PfpI, Hsp31 [uncultured Sulfurovum sp.]